MQKTQVFDHLKEWDRRQLYARLEEIKPKIDFLLRMHNAKEKTIAFMLTFLDPSVVREELFFSTKNLIGFDEFPELLNEFIHNFCTYLCAEKHEIEALLLDKQV